MVDTLHPQNHREVTGGPRHLGNYTIGQIHGANAGLNHASQALHNLSGAALVFADKLPNHRTNHRSLAQAGGSME
jgi:hypothetical protein